MCCVLEPLQLHYYNSLGLNQLKTTLCCAKWQCFVSRLFHSVLSPLPIQCVVPVPRQSPCDTSLSFLSPCWPWGSDVQWKLSSAGGRPGLVRSCGFIPAARLHIWDTLLQQKGWPQVEPSSHLRPKPREVPAVAPSCFPFRLGKEVWGKPGGWWPDCRRWLCLWRTWAKQPDSGLPAFLSICFHASLWLPQGQRQYHGLREEYFKPWVSWNMFRVRAALTL